jgi:hypothetical protein
LGHGLAGWGYMGSALGRAILYMHPTPGGGYVFV